MNTRRPERFARGGNQSASRCLTTLLLAASLLTAGSQSGLNNLMFTVGTSTRDAQNRDWSFLLWQGTDPHLLMNRAFAIYAKSGDASSSALYVRKSVATLQTDPAVIDVLLNRAVNLGDNRAMLEERIVSLFQKLMPVPDVPLPNKVSIVIRGAMDDPAHFNNLILISRLHPGMSLCLGMAFAEMIPAGMTTYEVRQYDLAKNQDVAVVGRVTVTAGSPTVLPAPGAPLQLPDVAANAAMGHLNAKFRWATPDPLRRLSLLNYGFNLYRMKAAFAVGNGYDVAPPSTVTLLSLLASQPNNVRRVNRLPLLKTRDFTAADVANFVADPKTFFGHDDNRRFETNGVPFQNGEQFYYFVTARDVLSRDGAVSMGTLVTMCDRMPPAEPKAVKVENDYSYNTTTLASKQVLKVTWKQNDSTTKDPTTAYYVYRWTNINQIIKSQANPLANRIAGPIAHTGVGPLSYTDDGAGSPGVPADLNKTFWYTVRAEDDGACGGNLSGNSAPTFGVLRDRVGPAGPGGRIVSRCCRPDVNHRDTHDAPPMPGLNPDLTYFQPTLTRLNSEIEWADFYATAVGRAGTFIGRAYFSGANNEVSVSYATARLGQQEGNLDFFAQVGTHDRATSTFAMARTTGEPPPNQIRVVTFEGVVVSATHTNVPGQPDPCDRHCPKPPGTNSVSGIDICATPTPTAMEYKFYRRIDFGPLTLIKQGEITNPAVDICITDFDLPANPGTACYYAQLFDEHGNASPLVLLADCIKFGGLGQLPRPLLSPLEPEGLPSAPMMNLRWHCAPHGVDRFEVNVGVENPGTLTENLNGELSPLLSSNTVSASPNFIAVKIDGKAVTNDFKAYVTPRVGPNFGDGALFLTVANVVTNRKYTVFIVALGKDGSAGERSNAEEFIWTEKQPVGPQVPWPDRPLPDVAGFHTNIAAVRLPNAQYPGAAVRLGEVTMRGSFSGQIEQTDPPFLLTHNNPVVNLYTNVAGKKLFPVAMYRYQVANTRFPVVSGDIVQVSPLMEKIAYQLSNNQYGPVAVVHDPFIGIFLENVNEPFRWSLFLKDTQPVIGNARYRYLLVRFDPETKEPVQVIPTNDVEITP